MKEQLRTLKYLSWNEEDTRELAIKLAAWVKPGAVITLDGELGVGKTAFSKAFAQAIGVEQVVNSPTFTIVKEYDGRLPFYHMDVYRITLEEAEELGLDEYFFGEGVTLIEWASKIETLLPAARLELLIEYVEEGRLFHLKPVGADFIPCCESLEREGLLFE